jgi:Flp pilus assembly protein TadD
MHRYEEALGSYEKVLRVQRDHVGALLNKGGVLMELGHFVDALVIFEALVELCPNDAKVYSNRGSALVELKCFQEACQSFEHAIEIAPSDPLVYLNWANALIGIGKIDVAVQRLEQAIRIDPGYAEAFNNLGYALKIIGANSEAIKAYDRAIALDPTLARAYLNKSLLLLLLGDFDQGWLLHEWRWQTKEYLKHPPRFAQPLWIGQSKPAAREGLVGTTILVHSEQGLGDTIQFARYLPLLAELGARVVFELPSVLLSLLKGIPGVVDFIAQGQEPPVADFHCPLLSLPLVFKTTLATVPSPQAYLEADAQKLQQWSGRMGGKSRLRVGLVWSGNSQHKNDHNRSIPLETLLAQLPEQFELVSLQREVREVDQRVLESHARVRHFGYELEDFSDTAALCALMDVVISVDTSVAHLSGALGRPTWVLLPHVPDWRWLLDRDDSPWYAHAKLYRQASPGEWGPVFQQLSFDLINWDHQIHPRLG